MAARKTPPDRRSKHLCGTDDLHRRLAAASPEYRRRAREIEYETRRFEARHAGEGMKTGIVRIPTVVHIVWNLPDQNPSDADVHTAIAALNADFRLTNADAVNIPPHFAPVAADTRIEFVLAARDPGCNPTTGIERRHTTQADFAFGDKGYKGAAIGLPQWPPHHYLNIWVANLKPGVPGYSQYPSGLSTNPAEDGIVVACWAFGVNPAHVNPLNRVLTHEAGHWLNLIHIWGDDTYPGYPGGPCAGSDQVADTPNQQGPTYTPLPGLNSSCGNAAVGGDMYMNYMDYTDEEYRCMFTRGQALRMHAALSVERAQILGSPGLIPPGAASTADLWMQDCPDDTGAEPYAGGGDICGSDDIWIRNGSDGLTYQDHQNPVAGATNTVYVRVRNRGCPAAGPQTGMLRLYWAKASPSLSWPQPWDGSVTSPALMGDALGSVTVSVPGGGEQIVSFSWVPPPPALYASFGADKAHFCLLARIETAASAPFGMSFPETTNLADNVRNNNDIIWKNVSVVYDSEPEIFADVVIGQYGREQRVARYAFETARGERRGFFDWGFLIIEARGKALNAWKRTDLAGEGFQRLEDGRLLITRPGAWIAAPPMKAGQFGTLRIRFVPDSGDAPLGARVFDLELTERDRVGRFLGGQHLLVKTGTSPGPRWDDRGGAFDGVDWLPAENGCGCH